MWKDAVWLGVPSNEINKWNILEGDMTGRFAYYRYEFIVEEQAELNICITANSKYRLWVNNQSVLSGPCKGDAYRHYYDEVDISNYLVMGKNVLAVKVLYCDPNPAISQMDERASIFGVVAPGGGHRLAVEGILRDKNQNEIACVTTGKVDWKVYLDGSFYLESNEITVNLGAICESIDFSKLPNNWKSIEYNMQHWEIAEKLEAVLQDDYTKTVGLIQRFPIKKREIPLLYEKEDKFVKEFTNSNILKHHKCVIPAGETIEILLDAGTIKNGYPKYQFKGGKGCKVSFTYFEKFVNETKVIKRTAWEEGEIVGLEDSIILDGNQLVYEPFWYRTFRFIRIQIEADLEEVTIFEPTFKKTGYPLEVESWVSSSESWVEEVWEICVRTLENCMMDTYMDCPFYEQMQFSMDTRLQAMFNYV